MPKSFLVKQKKARWSELTESEAVKLAAGEASEEECNRPEQSISPKRTLMDETTETKFQKGELEEEKEDEKKVLMANNRTELRTRNDRKTAESVKGKKHDSCYKHKSTVEASNGFGEFCWWTSISSRYELQNLPPPPKLISSVPRNGLTKVQHSAERQPVISLGQTHHFPGLTANGFGVVSFGDHRTVPPAPESIPLRASLDGFREMSLNFRHSSDGHCEAPTLCPSVVQATVPPPTAHLNGNHFFIHGHPFLASHRQQDCIPTLQHKQNQNRKADIDGEETKYKCEICNSSFTLQRLLNRHMKTHSFYKRYHCQFCTKGFNDTFDLKRHIRTHTGIKPFKCSRCDKSFTQRCSLEAHLTRVHGVLHKFGFRERRSKMFVCEDCGSTFTENSEFMKHLHEFHPETEKIIRARRNGGFAQKLKDVS